MVKLRAFIRYYYEIRLILKEKKMRQLSKQKSCACINFEELSLEVITLKAVEQNLFRQQVPVFFKKTSKYN